MQSLISRFGGMPATILKLVFLAFINACAIWALPTMITTHAWVMLVILVVSTLALDWLFLTRRYIPAKYLIIGGVFLTVFQIIPIVYNVAIAFTNYSTGHIGTKPEAVTRITLDSVAETDTSTSYDMIVARDSSGDVALILTPQILIEEPTADSGTTDTGTTDTGTTEFGPSDAASSDVTTEFGPSDAASSDVTTEFGPSGSPEPSTASSAGPSASAASDASAPAGNYPPTYIGTSKGTTDVPAADVQRDEFGTVTGVTGYTPVPESELSGLDAQLADFTIPGPNGTYISPQGLSTAVELTPTLTYDATAGTFTSLSTGVVYTDNGMGSFTDPNNPDDELIPGWKETIGLTNFSRIFTDPDITGPFMRVFVWTFAYAILTVLLTFALGLGLAIVMNRPGMRGQRIYRSLIIIPYAVPAFLSILVWAALLNDDFGAINQVLGTQIPWLFDPTWAKVSCLLVNLWLGLPYMFLITTGALQAIPSELQEAARIDGARNFQVFRLVNLPLLLVALTPLLIASFAYNFNNFNAIFLLTGGGPSMEGSSVAGSTDILISYTYKVAFSAGKGNDYGLAAAISIIIFFIVGTISMISFSRTKAMREERS
jgi:arabinogalactan oligomer/maltooligosaccharide transport system permease protein